MPVRSAEAVWQGNLRDGKGTLKLGSGAFNGAYTYASRFEEASGTNPEELIGAAHAGCFSMAFAGRLTKAGFPPQKIHTKAKVHLETGKGITRIELDSAVQASGIDEKLFQELASDAKANCTVSKALSGVEILLSANLVGR